MTNFRKSLSNSKMNGMRETDLQLGLAMIAKFTEYEQQFFGNLSPPGPPTMSQAIGLRRVV
jgi:hypothetical protein